MNPTIYKYITENAISGKIDKQTAVYLLKNLMQEENSDVGKDIAVIGIAARLPLADDIKQFWDILENGRECVRDFPEHRKNDLEAMLQYTNFPQSNKIEFLKAGYLERIDHFDYNFFNISPNEASVMSPSQRLFLETAWKALEDAGYGGKNIVGSRTGVYVGASSDALFDYKKAIDELDPSLYATAYATAVIGNLTPMIAARISYLLDLKGPNLTVDTTCSSSLVAVHLACQALRNQECEIALAGGVKIELMPLVRENKLGIESSDGKTRSFDNRGDGTGIGEGVVALVLKPLSKAMEDNDNIYAVIKGTAINHDGYSAGITAPNPASQTDVLVRAWKDAKIDPETLSYIEAHGTGTKLGDPIEILGIQRAFEQFTTKKQFCAISSVKSNMGHQYEAAGITGLLKAILAIKYERIPPSINFYFPNQEIDFESSPVFLNDRLLPWNPDHGPKRCGISSFSISGTNCHMVVEEKARQPERSSNTVRPLLFTLSVKNRPLFKELIFEYQRFTKVEKYNLPSVCYTANTGRGHYNYRIAMIVKNNREFEDKLELLSTIDLQDLAAGDIFYGQHKVVPFNKKIKEPYEITEAERKELSQIAGEKLNEYISDTGNIETLQEICKVYIRGAEIDWERWYQGEKPPKISLPSYPFEKTRSWFAIKDSWGMIHPDNLYYHPIWKIQEVNPIKAETGPARKTVLVLQDQFHRHLELIETLKSEGNNVIEATLDSGFHKMNPNQYGFTIQEDDYYKLCEDIFANCKIDQIIHLLTLHQDHNQNLKQFRDDLEFKLFSLINLLKAIARIENIEEITIASVSKYANAVTFEERQLNPLSSTLAGLGRIVKMECPSIRFKLVDLDDTTDYHCWLTELQVPSGSLVAYRNNKRYVQVLENLDIQSTPDQNTAIENDGVYVITGGTGGIGLEIAKFLSAQNHGIKLALINRGRIPPREQWDEMIDSGLDGNDTAKIKSLMEIEASGATVCCCSVDISQFDETKSCFDELREKFGKINGIIHCAGVEESELIVFQEPGSIRNVLAPKVIGTYILDQVTDSDKLGFFVLFSSIASIFGAPGKGSYAAANAFLDSFAVNRNKRGKRTILINWGPWKNIGMNIKYPSKGHFIFEPLETNRAIQAFQTVLNKNLSRLLIGKLNLNQETVLLLEKFADQFSENINNRIIQLKSKVNIKKIGVGHTGQVTLKGRGDGRYTPTEYKLAQIWGQVLGFQELNIHDNFIDLGGDSLLGMKIANLIKKELRIEFSMNEMFNYLTVFDFSNYIGQLMNNNRFEDIPLEPVEKRDFYPMSSAQKRLFITNKYSDVGISYNVPLVIIIEGKLDIQKLNYTLAALFKRHECLRTSFDIRDNELVQIIHDTVNFTIETAKPSRPTSDFHYLIEEFIRPFDLSVAPLLRVGVAELSPERYLLLIDLHHIITDGISLDIFVEDFINIYEGQTLPELAIQYKEFTLWQNKLLNSEFIKRQEQFWLDIFSGSIPVINLPTDFPRPAIKNFKGDSIQFEVGGDMLERLTKFSKETETTSFIILLTIYYILLHKYTRQDDITIGTPIAGRTHADLYNVMGLFVNMLPLRNYMGGNKSFKKFLSEVKATTLKAYDNQDYQYELLVEKLNLTNDSSRNPVFDTMFTMEQLKVSSVMVDQLKMERYRFSPPISKFDLSVYARETDNKLLFVFEYCSVLFKKETIQEMFNNYVKIMKIVMDNRDIKINEIELIDAVKKRQISSEILKRQQEIDINLDFLD